MKTETIIQGLVAVAVLGVATAVVFFRPQSQHQTVIVSPGDVPTSEQWEVKEVVNGTTLKASRGWKIRDSSTLRY